MAFTVEKDWTSKAGFRCVVTMGDAGHRCGYVGVNKMHPLYCVGYNEDLPKNLMSKWKKVLSEDRAGKRGMIDLFCLDKDNPKLGILFDVHGGITYSGKGKYPVESDLWWFGYDCAHVGDAKDLLAMPEKDREFYRDLDIRYPVDGVIRTLDYCIDECESLASQLVMSNSASKWLVLLISKIREVQVTPKGKIERLRWRYSYKIDKLKRRIKQWAGK